MIFIPGIILLICIYVFFAHTFIGQSNPYIRRIRTAFDPNEPSLVIRRENQKLFKAYLKDKPFGEGLGLSGVDVQDKFKRYTTSIPTDSWYVKIWVETGIIGLVLYLAVHGVLFAWCGWILMFKIMNKRLRGLLTAWLRTAAGFYLAAYANDVMQYPNSIPIYTAFALCFAGPYIDKRMQQSKETELKNEQ